MLGKIGTITLRDNYDINDILKAIQKGDYEITHKRTFGKDTIYDIIDKKTVRNTENIQNWVIENDTNGRYKDFLWLKHPDVFKYTIGDKDLVQIHDIHPNNYGIVGYCGSFEWKNGEIKSLDGDVYSSDMLIYGFRCFNSENDKVGIDILVTEW